MEETDELERLRELVDRNPASNVFVALANALCEAGQPDEAVVVCRDALALHTDVNSAVVRAGKVALCRALSLEGDDDAALRELLPLLSEEPAVGEAFWLLGEILIDRETK